MTETIPNEPSLALDRRDAAALAMLCLLAVVVLMPILFLDADRAPGLPEHDARTQWYPWRAYAAESLKGGVLPLWNPYVLCGTPFVGNFQSALFYPPNLVFLVCPVGVAARISLLFHLWLSLVFAYLLARAFGCGWGGCAITAMTFTFCAAQFLRIPAGHWGVSCAIPWMPLIFLCVAWAFRKPSLTLFVVGGCAVALQVLSGVPQVVFITALTAGTYALLRGMCPSFSWAERFRRWGIVAGIFIAGAALSAIQLVPAIEAARHGARSLEMQQKWIELFSLGPENVLTFLLPGLFGTEHGMDYWGRFYFWEMNAYIGIVALTLVAAGVIAARPRVRAVRLGIIAVLMLLLALGKHTPVMELASSLLPMSGLFRGSSKFLMGASMVLALLAGIGADAVLNEPRKAWRRSGIAAMVLAGAVGLMLLIALSGGGMYDALQRTIYASGEILPPVVQIKASAIVRSTVVFEMVISLVILAGLCLALGPLARRHPKALRFALVVLVALDLMAFSRLFLSEKATFETRGGVWHEAATAIRDTGLPARAKLSGTRNLNDGMLDRVHTLEGIEPNPPVRFHRLFMRSLGLPETLAPSFYQPEALAPKFYHEARKAFGILKATASKYIVVPAGSPKPLPSAHAIHSGKSWQVFELPEVPLRARILHERRQVDSDVAIQAVLATDADRIVILEEQPLLPRSGFEESITVSSALIAAEGPNRVLVRAQLHQADWLVLSDNYYPGWRAWVNGQPARILRANYAFRAVALPPGRHQVLFEYRPLSLRIGFWISMGTILILAAVVIREGIKNRAGRSRRPA